MGAETSPLVWRIRGRVLTVTRSLVMGVVNVTPDSFSDGGRYLDAAAAIDHGRCLADEGADLLDVGGESTRPGSAPVSLDEELRRVVPVVEALARRVEVPISVDTMKAEVARQALAAGAAVVNDVTALLGDPAMPEAIRAAGAGVVLMHMQGTPQTMQAAPSYPEGPVAAIERFFEARLHDLAALGIDREQAALDPGIGFGKTDEHNRDLLRHLGHFRRFGRPVCLGVSRKGFLGRLLGRPLGERLPGSLAVAAHAILTGPAHILRVHDVAATRDVMRVLEWLRTE
jgi:dihydropteroate synthase